MRPSVLLRRESLMTVTLLFFLMEVVVILGKADLP